MKQDEAFANSLELANHIPWEKVVFLLGQKALKVDQGVVNFCQKLTKMWSTFAVPRGLWASKVDLGLVNFWGVSFSQNFETAFAVSKALWGLEKLTKVWSTFAVPRALWAWKVDLGVVNFCCVKRLVSLKSWPWCGQLLGCLVFSKFWDGLSGAKRPVDLKSWPWCGQLLLC